MAVSSDRVVWRTAGTIADLDHAHRITDATERPFCLHECPHLVTYLGQGNGKLEAVAMISLLALRRDPDTPLSRARNSAGITVTAAIIAALAVIC
jgi:hypothetical protein